MEYKFELSKASIELFEKWVDEQVKKSRVYTEYAERFSIQLTPTVIGTIATGIDHHLKEEKLLNDLYTLL